MRRARSPPGLGSTVVDNMKSKRLTTSVPEMNNFFDH